MENNKLGDLNEVFPAANPCASEEVCVPASECTPMQQAEESKRKDFKECGRDKDKGLLVGNKTDTRWLPNTASHTTYLTLHHKQRTPKISNLTQFHDVFQVCCPKGEKPQTDSPEEEASGEDLLPKNDECGLRPETVYRIMFGEEAPLNAYPWLALLGYKSKT